MLAGCKEPAGAGEFPYKEDSGDRRTFKGLKNDFGNLVLSLNRSATGAFAISFRVLSRKTYDRRYMGY